MLFDLSHRLRHATQLEEISQAVLLYKNAAPFLKANSNFASFAQIDMACKEVLESIGSRLRRQLDDGFIGNPVDFESLISALLCIEEDATAELVKTYFDWYHNTILSSTIGSTANTSFEAHAKLVREAFLDPMVLAIARADALFPDEGTEELKVIFSLPPSFSRRSWLTDHNTLLLFFADYVG